MNELNDEAGIGKFDDRSHKYRHNEFNQQEFEMITKVAVTVKTANAINTSQGPLRS